MRYSIVILATITFLLAGCGSQSSNGDKPKAAKKKKEQADGYLGTVLKQPKRAQEKVNLYGIRQSIQAFKVLNGRTPRSLKELDSSGYSIPAAPKGMAYRYDPMTGKVVLKKAPESGK